MHVSAEGKKFRAAILVRDAYICHWCGGEATSVDYLRALVDGGSALDEANAMASCLRCNFRRGAEITNGGGSFAAATMWLDATPLTSGVPPSVKAEGPPSGPSLWYLVSTRVMGC